MRLFVVAGDVIRRSEPRVACMDQMGSLWSVLLGHTARVIWPDREKKATHAIPAQSMYIWFTGWWWWEGSLSEMSQTPVSGCSWSDHHHGRLYRENGSTDDVLLLSEAWKTSKSTEEITPGVLARTMTRQRTLIRDRYLRAVTHSINTHHTQSAVPSRSFVNEWMNDGRLS